MTLGPFQYSRCFQYFICGALVVAFSPLAVLLWAICVFAVVAQISG